MARRVLLDENLPHALRKHLTHHEAQTAAFAGFAGLKNGQLLAAAESAGFEVLLTGDRTLHLEQNLTLRRLAVVSLSAISWPVIEPYVAKIVAAVDAVERGPLYRSIAEFSVDLAKGAYTYALCSPEANYIARKAATRDPYHPTRIRCSSSGKPMDANPNIDPSSFMTMLCPSPLLSRPTNHAPKVFSLITPALTDRASRRIF
jgi:hypothetical protein